MKKVILSIVLVCTLLCGVCIPSFAITEHDEYDMGTEAHVGYVRHINVGTAFYVIKDIYDASCNNDEDDVNSPLSICSSVIYGECVRRGLEIFFDQASVERFLERFLNAEREGTPAEDDVDEDGYLIGLYYFSENRVVQVLRYLETLMERGEGNEILYY